MIRAVLDTSVLFPTTLRDTLLRAAEARLFSPFWSGRILAELSRSLVEHNRTTKEGAAYLLQEMNSSFAGASVSGFDHLLDQLTNHPKDRHVLGAALVAGADTIVTFNIRHFQAPTVEPFGISTETPDVFLCLLLSLDADRVVGIINQQAEDHANPPLSPIHLVDRLTRHAPEFSRQLRAVLA